MSTTLIVVLASIVLFFLLFILLFAFRERVEVGVEEDVLLLNYPFSKKRIALKKELKSWKVQQAYYLRLGQVYSINMLFRDGKRAAVSSRLNEENYDLLYDYLSSRYPDRREKD